MIYLANSVWKNIPSAMLVYVLFLTSSLWTSFVALFQGVVHTIGGYMLFTAATFKYVFDYHPEDIYWCTADIGWITGHSYLTYGPLANGATSVIVSSVVWWGLKSCTVQQTVLQCLVRDRMAFLCHATSSSITGNKAVPKEQSVLCIMKTPVSVPWHLSEILERGCQSAQTILSTVDQWSDGMRQLHLIY